MRMVTGVKATADHGISRERVHQLEEAMKKMPDPLTLPVRHHFADAIYGRELKIHKGTLLTGAIHKKSQLNVLVMGDMSVLINGAMQRVRPPFVFVAPAGVKRVMYAHEDSIWLVVHGTRKTNLEKIEEEFTAKTEDEYLTYCRQLELKGRG